MEAYNKEDFDTDCEWLIGFGLDKVEAEEFIINTLSDGFKLTPKEYRKLMDETK